MFVHGTSPPALDARIRARIIERDGAKCCITGKSGSLTDPLVVIPLLPIPTRWLNAEVSLDLQSHFDLLTLGVSLEFSKCWAHSLGHLTVTGGLRMPSGRAA